MTPPPSPPRIAVIGATGGAGRALCEGLLAHTEADVIAIARGAEPLHAQADALAARFGAGRITARPADARALGEAGHGADLWIVAAALTDATEALARGAIAAGADWIDLAFDRGVTARLRALEGEIAAAGRCFITQAGFHPGLPAALVRLGASRLDRATEATIALAMSGDLGRPESAVEIVDDIARWSARIYEGGRWREAGWRDAATLELDDFGRRTCLPMWLPELEGLPEALGLERLGLYVAGFGWRADWVVSPLILGLERVAPGRLRLPMARLLLAAVRRAGGPAGARVVAEIRGERGGALAKARVVVGHADPYALTALPVVACARQLLDGAARRPGVHRMGQLVDPERLFVDIAALGLETCLAVDPL